MVHEGVHNLTEFVDVERLVQHRQRAKLSRLHLQLLVSKDRGENERRNLCPITEPAQHPCFACT